MRFLRFADFVEPPACCHLGRTVVQGLQGSPHTHDFAEIFWIEAGQGEHRVNGETQALAAGDLALIRPTDTHTFASSPGQSLTLFNIAFPVETLTFLADRYGAETPFFGSLSSTLPPRASVTPPELDRLRRSAEGLLVRRQSRLELERLLLLVGHLVAKSPGEAPVAALPDWLRQAIDAVREPSHFRRGPEHLAKLAGRSHEHTARVLKQALGLTPSGLLNQMRCDYAARQLVRTDDEILDIADACGYGSISHFYACFQQRHGLPPRRYREAHRALL